MGRDEGNFVGNVRKRILRKDKRHKQKTKVSKDKSQETKVKCMGISEILGNESFTRENIISLLESEGEDRTLLFKKSAETKGKIHR